MLLIAKKQADFCNEIEWILISNSCETMLKGKSGHAGDRQVLTSVYYMCMRINNHCVFNETDVSLKKNCR